ALDMFERVFEQLTSTILLKHSYADPDLTPVRGHPRFKKALEAAETRLGVHPEDLLLRPQRDSHQASPRDNRQQ
nr:hypothetical protein [Pseudomonadota bacterium]